MVTQLYIASIYKIYIGDITNIYLSIFGSRQMTFGCLLGNRRLIVGKCSTGETDGKYWRIIGDAR